MSFILTTIGASWYPRSKCSLYFSKLHSTQQNVTEGKANREHEYGLFINND